MDQWMTRIPNSGVINVIRNVPPDVDDEEFDKHLKQCSDDKIKETCISPSGTMAVALTEKNFTGVQQRTFNLKAQNEPLTTDPIVFQPVGSGDLPLGACVWVTGLTPGVTEMHLSLYLESMQVSEGDVTVILAEGKTMEAFASFAEMADAECLIMDSTLAICGKPITVHSIWDPSPRSAQIKQREQSKPKSPKIVDYRKHKAEPPTESYDTGRDASRITSKGDDVSEKEMQRVPVLSEKPPPAVTDHRPWEPKPEREQPIPQDRVENLSQKVTDHRPWDPDSAQSQKPRLTGHVSPPPPTRQDADMGKQSDRKPWETRTEEPPRRERKPWEVDSSTSAERAERPSGFGSAGYAEQRPWERQSGPPAQHVGVHQRPWDSPQQAARLQTPAFSPHERRAHTPPPTALQQPQGLHEQYGTFSPAGARDRHKSQENLPQFYNQGAYGDSGPMTWAQGQQDRQLAYNQGGAYHDSGPTSWAPGPSGAQQKLFSPVGGQHGGPAAWTPVHPGQFGQYSQQPNTGMNVDLGASTPDKTKAETAEKDKDQSQAKKTKQSTETMEVKFPKYKLQVLQFAIDSGTVEVEDCEAKCDLEKGKMILTSTEKSNLVDAKLILMETATSLEECLLPMPLSLAQVLCEPRGADFLKEEDIMAAIAVKADEPYLVMLQENYPDTLDKFNELFDKRSISFKSSHFKYLTGDVWKTTKEELTKDEVLIIYTQNEHNVIDSTISRSGGKIVVQGARSPVKDAARRIEKELKKWSVITDKFGLMIGIGRMLKEHGNVNSKLENIKKSCGVELAVDSSDQGWSVAITGQEDEVVVAKAEIEELAKAIAYDTFIEVRKGVKGLLDDPMWKISLRGLEQEKQCIVEPRVQINEIPDLDLDEKSTDKEEVEHVEDANPKDDGEDKSNETDEAKPAAVEEKSGSSDSESDSEAEKEEEKVEQTEPQADQAADPNEVYRNANVHIVLEQGDITKYKAEILVDTVGNYKLDLKHGGTVSSAFLKAGGSEIQEGVDKGIQEQKRKKYRLRL